jgi:DnaK suppressor protein
VAKKAIKKAIKKQPVKKKAITSKKVEKPATKKKRVLTSKKVGEKLTKRKSTTKVSSKKTTKAVVKKKVEKKSRVRRQTVELKNEYHPEKDKEYMSKAMLNYFRQILINMKQQLYDQAATTVSNLKEAVIQEPDMSDRASSEEAFGLELRERDRGRRLLKKIEHALERIDEQEYGYCDSCGDQIGVKRLQLRPTATLCVDCKTFDEIREKQLGQSK